MVFFKMKSKCPENKNLLGPTMAGGGREGDEKSSVLKKTEVKNI